MHHYPHWIGNTARPDAHTLDIDSPWDGSPVARAAVADAAIVEEALSAAVKGFQAMRQASSAERSGWLEAVAHGLETRRDLLADEICAQAGKPISLARAEVDRAVLTFRFAAEEAHRITGEVLPLDVTAAARGRQGIARRFPRGVVSGIVPFNFPLNLAAHKMAPALACGCSVILKPPPQAPGATFRLAEVAAEAGLPAGSVNAILPSIGVAGPLVEDPRVAVLSFTGSARVGWELKARAYRRQVTLELGGNAAVIIDASADLDRAAERCAVGGFAFAGQVCIKAQRLLVERSVYPAFRDRFLAAIDRVIKVGDPRDDSVLCGPVIDDGAAHRIEDWVAEAVRAGAAPLKPLHRQGRLLSPAVLENAPPDANVSCEEIFGPVVTLAAFDDFAEAIRQVNCGRYGLQAGVFTNDLKRSLAAFESIETGAVILNDAPTFRVDPMPYGGTKASGFGREGLRYAIEEMTELRLLVLPAVSAGG